MNFIHKATAVLLGCWTALFIALGVFSLLGIWGLGASVGNDAAAATGVFGFFSLLLWPAIWAGPALFLLLVAYLTRPQAWREP
jgi:hypothetical protein